jgi:branched-chain amino acid transport system permease protein
MTAPSSHRPNRPRSSRWIAAAVLLILAVSAPFIVSSYQTLQMSMVLIYFIALLGLNLLVGYNGQVSLGHGAFFGVGAYSAVILLQHAGLPYWATIPLAGVISLAIGFLLGIPALRLEGHYLALATFALALALPQILKHPSLTKWTGGFMGVEVGPMPVPAGLPVGPDQWLYFVCLGVAIVMLAIAWNLTRGRVGRAIVAIRDHPTAAMSMGINLAFYKSVTFGISAMFAGIAGALGAFATQFISPDSFDIFLSISFLVGVVVGGLATLSGAIFGAIFIQFVPNVAGEISKSAPWALYGLTLLACMYLMPQGVAGLARQLTSIFQRTAGRKIPDDAARSA